MNRFIRIFFWSKERTHIMIGFFKSFIPTIVLYLLMWIPFVRLTHFSSAHWYISLYVSCVCAFLSSMIVQVITDRKEINQIGGYDGVWGKIRMYGLFVGAVVLVSILWPVSIGIGTYMMFTRK